MKFVRMGTTGVEVSQICLGCMSFGKSMGEWALSDEESLPIITKALEAGINLFDTADVYGRGESEQILGGALKTLNVRRDETVIATKVFAPMGSGPNRAGLSRKHIMASIDASLKRLGTDYVDLYQIHRFDYNTPVEETIEALDDVVKSGKTRYVGASSMFAYQFSKYLHRADRMGRARFATMQNHYNLLYREEEREMIPLCIDEGVGLIPWSPLAGGRLVGNREAGTVRSTTRNAVSRYNRPADQAVVDALNAVAKRRGEPPAQVAVAWMLSKRGMTAPIVGATKLGHLDDPIKAVDTPLGAEDIAELEAPYEAQALIGALGPESAEARQIRPTSTKKS
jgi:1-deoxyxylulose-5-phosphate synthase